MIAFSEGEPKGWRCCPNCGCNESTGWFWDEEAEGHSCPKCGAMVRNNGSIIEQRVETTVYYKEGAGWIFETTFRGGMTKRGLFLSKEAAINEAKRDNPDEITVIDRRF